MAQVSQNSLSFNNIVFLLADWLGQILQLYPSRPLCNLESIFYQGPLQFFLLDALWMPHYFVFRQLLAKSWPSINCYAATMHNSINYGALSWRLFSILQCSVLYINSFRAKRTGPPNSVSSFTKIAIVRDCRTSFSCTFQNPKYTYFTDIIICKFTEQELYTLTVIMTSPAVHAPKQKKPK